MGMGSERLKFTKWDYLATHNYFCTPTNMAGAWAHLDSWGYAIIAAWAVLTIGGAMYQMNYHFDDHYSEYEDCELSAQNSYERRLLVEARRHPHTGSPHCSLQRPRQYKTYR